MRQKKDLIIQLEIYSVALNFIWFTQAKLKTVCPFRKDISLAKVWAQSRQHAVSQISSITAMIVFTCNLHLADLL